MSSPPTVRPPRPLCCLLWLCSYLSCFWSQHTQPGVAKWLSHPPLEYTHHALPPLCQLWSPHLSPENAHHARTSTSCGYMASHQSMEYAHHAQPGVAMWLSHPSLEYAHHAHLSASASCGYVAISFILGVRTPRPARCGYVAISPIPGVRPPRPPLPAMATWLSRLSLEYAHHVQPGVAISPVPGVRPPRPPLCLCQL